MDKFEHSHQLSSLGSVEDWAKALVIPAMALLLDLSTSHMAQAAVEHDTVAAVEDTITNSASPPPIVSPQPTERVFTRLAIRADVPLTGRGDFVPGLFHKKYGTIDLVRLADPCTEQLLIKIKPNDPSAADSLGIPAQTFRTESGYLIKIGTSPNWVCLVIPDSATVRIDAWKLEDSDPPTFRKVEVKVDSHAQDVERRQKVTLIPESLIPGQKTYRISSEVTIRLTDGTKEKECSETVVPKIEPSSFLTQRTSR